jgi:biopolymer transport protein ExbD
MADINNTAQNKRHPRTLCKKRSTTVDLAPMVDLGFILLTFFVFTAAITRPMAMKLAVPNDKNDTIHDNLCESCVLTVLLGKDNNIWYYEGKANYALEKLTDYSAQGVRKLIQKRKRDVYRLKGDDNFVLIIKPSARSNFKNLVDIVDECSISMVKRYYIDDINTTDTNWLSSGIASSR